MEKESKKSFPPSLSVATMLKLGKLIKPPKLKAIPIEIEGFEIKNGWTAARIVTFSVESGSFAEGGFRKAYKCESYDEKFPDMWVLKRYKEESVNGMKELGIKEEEHARKQVQMHALAQNIASQMTKNIPEEFGETFTYDCMHFGKIKHDDETEHFVTIERYMEGEFTKYINNNGDTTSTTEDTVTKKAEALVHYSYQVSQGEFLLVDIQGTGYQLYDPEVASKALTSNVSGDEQLNFCMGNMSTCAIHSFFENHICSIYCNMLGRKEDDPKYYISL